MPSEGWDAQLLDKGIELLSLKIILWCYRGFTEPVLDLVKFESLYCLVCSQTSASKGTGSLRSFIVVTYVEEFNLTCGYFFKKKKHTDVRTMTYFLEEKLRQNAGYRVT